MVSVYTEVCFLFGPVFLSGVWSARDCGDEFLFSFRRLFIFRLPYTHVSGVGFFLTSYIWSCTYRDNVVCADDALEKAGLGREFI